MYQPPLAAQRQALTFVTLEDLLYKVQRDLVVP
jgi:hypothetical protein